MNPVPVSVIIPCYNVDPYLEECLASVICQTLAGIEIICIDDGSEDATFPLLETLAKRHGALRLLRHEQNKGLAAARNTGIRNARGEYLFFLDSDDIIPDQRSLEILYQAAIEDDADEVLGRIVRWYPETGMLRQEYHATYQKVERRKIRMQQYPEFRSNMIACNKLIRRELLERNSLYFDENIKKFEDNTFSCALHVLSETMSYVNHTTYYHRQRTGERKSLRQDITRNDYYCCYQIVRFFTEFLSLHPDFVDIYKGNSAWVLKQAIVSFSNFSRSDSEIVDFIDILAALLPNSPYPLIPWAIRNILGSLTNDNHAALYSQLLEFYATPTLVHHQRRYEELRKAARP